jgi:subtilase-type serine protease
MTSKRTILFAGAALTALSTGIAYADEDRAPARTGDGEAVFVANPDGAMTRRILVRDDVGGATTPGEALDNSFDVDDEWGSTVQIFLQNNGTGGVFLNCTGSLINPRTVLTAAHCLNSSSSEAYGLPGQAPLTMLIGFGPDTEDPLFNYIFTGAGYSQGGVALSTDVIIHPSANLDNGGLPFPWADVAMIAINEPVTDVPTIGMLFSPLQELTHVIVGGYGTFGTGDLGELGFGFRRLIGENQLGILGSPADLADTVFPAFAPTANFGFETQDFYMIDFDNPNRTADQQDDCTFTPFGPSCTSIDGVRAIDWFDGDALPNEAGTAPGDSGSALIADQLADFPLILGVLSGGFDFFGIGNQYSDISFYNPLFPFYEFISANSPYKYVSAVAGDGLWTDPDHWTQDLDPNFYIIDGTGQIVNGLPEGPEEGVYSSDNNLGTILGVDIADYPTDDSPFLPPRSAGAGPAGAESFDAGLGGAGSEPGAVQIGTISQDILAVLGAGETGREEGEAEGAATSETDREFTGSITGATPEDAPGFGNNLPQSSVLQGPGSTGFVPNNTDGTPGTAFENPAQYFDVSFTQSGTTTLTGDGALLDIVVDQVSLLNGGATLDIVDGGGLFSLIGVNVMVGTLRVGELGYLDTPLLINDMGIVTGSGLIVSDLFLNRGGIVDPDFTGESTTLGELTILGDYVQQGQGVLRIDIFDNAGTATSNDLLNILGAAAIDGTLMTAVADPTAVPRGSQYTVLQALDGLTGTFANEMTQFSAVMSFDVAYGANAVTLTAVADDYANVLAGSHSNTLAVAGALDSVTSPDSLPSGDLGAVVASLDALRSAAQLEAALASTSATETFVFDQLGFTAARSFNAILSQRPRTAHAARGGFDVTGLRMRSSDSPVMLASTAQDAPMPASAGRDRILPDNVTAFLSGDIAFADNSLSNVAGEVETASVAAGLETQINRHVSAGAALIGSWMEAGENDRSFDGDAIGLGGYVSAANQIFYGSANIGFLQHSFESERPVFNGTGVALAGGDTEATQLLAGAEVGANFALGGSGEFGPVLRVRTATLDIDGYQETGAGVFAVAVDSRELTETVSSLGLTAWKAVNDKLVLSGELTWENYLDGDEASTAAVALLSAPNAPFAITGAAFDDSYYALRVGAGYEITPGVIVQGSYQADLDRDDFEYERFTVSLNFGF